MTLTRGSGPLGGSPGQANYTIEAPAHRLLFEADPRRLRAVVGDALVLDTTGARLLHETGIRPVAYVPLVAGRLRPSDKATSDPYMGAAI